MNYIIDGVQLTAIADAIREKTGESNTMTVNEMPDEISGISGGIADKGKILDITFPELTIACNGNNSDLAGPVIIIDMEGV